MLCVAGRCNTQHMLQLRIPSTHADPHFTRLCQASLACSNFIYPSPVQMDHLHGPKSAPTRNAIPTLVRATGANHRRWSPTSRLAENHAKRRKSAKASRSSAAGGAVTSTPNARKRSLRVMRFRCDWIQLVQPENQQLLLKVSETLGTLQCVRILSYRYQACWTYEALYARVKRHLVIEIRPRLRLFISSLRCCHPHSTRRREIHMGGYVQKQCMRRGLWRKIPGRVVEASVKHRCMQKVL